MTDAAHEQRERRLFLKQIDDANKGTLRERQDAREAFADAMAHDPERVAERIEWLIVGNYGYGACIAARDVLRRKRVNRSAWLVSTIGALEWMCPPAFSLGAWKKLTPTQKERLDRAVQSEIRRAERDLAAEKNPPRRARRAPKRRSRY